MILDTSFMIDYLRGDEGAGDAMENVGVAYLSSVTVMELWEEIRLAESTESERTAVEGFLKDIDELAFTRECAMTAGRLNAELVENGTPVDEIDVMIAATAVVHDKPVLTRNEAHFGAIEGVKVVTY